MTFVILTPWGIFLVPEHWEDLYIARSYKLPSTFHSEDVAGMDLARAVHVPLLWPNPSLSRRQDIVTRLWNQPDEGVNPSFTTHFLVVWTWQII